MPQPQSLSAQHGPSIVGEFQPQSKQSIGLLSPTSTLAQSNQQWQRSSGVEQQIPEKQEEEEVEAQVSQSTSSYASLEPQNHQGRSISCKDIQLVQNLIERCLQLYMNKAEVINTLLYQAKIQSSFTSLVWQKLEEQNPDFFKAYYTRLKLKKQITLFNTLLEQQAHLMHEMQMLPASSHMSVHDMHLSSMDYTTQLQTRKSADHPVMSVPSRSPIPQSEGLPVQEDYLEPHNGSGSNCLVEVKSEVLSSGQTSKPGILSDSNSKIHQASTFPICPVGHAMEMQSLNINPPALPLDASLSTHEPHAQGSHVILPMGAPDSEGNNVREIVGSLQHLPRNFSLSDLTAELGPNSDFGPFGSYSSTLSTIRGISF